MFGPPCTIIRISATTVSNISRSAPTRRTGLSLWDVHKSWTAKVMLSADKTNRNNTKCTLSVRCHYNTTPVTPCSTEHFLKCILTALLSLYSRSYKPHENCLYTVFWMYWMMYCCTETLWTFTTNQGLKKLWNFEARARIGLQRNLDFINKNVRLVIRTHFQKLKYYFCCINGLKIHSCFTAILNASLTINLNGICMWKSINMRVKFEARIQIFPGTDFHFPSTSVLPGTFLGSATNVRLDSFMSLNMLFKVTTVAQLLLTYVTREPSTFIVWLHQMSLELITPCKTV